MEKESREDPSEDLKEAIIKFVKDKLPSRSPMRTKVIKKILKNRIDGQYFFVQPAPWHIEGDTEKLHVAGWGDIGEKNARRKKNKKGDKRKDSQ